LVAVRQTRNLPRPVRQAASQWVVSESEQDRHAKTLPADAGLQASQTLVNAASILGIVPAGTNGALHGAQSRDPSLVT
jgi:hypothetical protein